jgi:hypothetical protein
MITGVMKKENLGQGKRQGIPLCLFLWRLPQFSPTCPPLTGEDFSMKREYVVMPFNGRFLVFRELRNEEGYLMNRKITDNFDNFADADAKAKLGNYIVKKASEAFKELAGVR